MGGEIKIKNRKTKIIILSIGGSVIFIFLLFFIFLNQSLKPALIQDKVADRVKVDSILKVQFDWPVSKNVRIVTKPQIYGEITYENNLFGRSLARTLVFTPELNFWPETTYQIKLINVKNALPSFLPAKEYTFSFTTESLPALLSVETDPEREIKADSLITLTFDKASRNLADYEFDLTPAVALGEKLSENGKTYTLIPKNLLSQGQEYALTVKRKVIRNYYQKEVIGFQAEPEKIWTGKFVVREAPYLENFRPTGQTVGLNEEIAVTFNEAVERSSFINSVVISPAVEGEWQSDDNQTFIYKKASLARDTLYRVTIGQGLKTQKSGYLAEDAVHTFKTIGPVKVVNFSPGEGATGVSVNRSLSVTFDPAVDHLSGQSHFSLVPAVEGDFSWEGEVMTFRPKTALSFNTAYQVTLTKGVKGKGGFNSESDFTASFTTEFSVTKLDVPFHRQEHNLSCEVATLVMVLAYRGINVSEAALIDYIGFDPTPKSGGVWGNPNLAFVGDIDGRQPSTGYGVYWDPVVKAASQYRTAYSFTSWTISDITGQIKKGNPVIFWGTAGSGQRIDWKTSQGGNVVAVSGEHTRVAIGFIGSADNPSKIITLDPLSGEKYFTVSSFLWNWGLLGYSGVVVE